jgi:hypothetical protein
MVLTQRFPRKQTILAFLFHSYADPSAAKLHKENSQGSDGGNSGSNNYEVNNDQGTTSSLAKSLIMGGIH